MTKIEWCEATWNPVVGCSVVSPGCTNCYAMRQAHRLAANPATPHYAGTTRTSRAGPVWTGKVAIAAERVLTAPLRRKAPTTYVVNSMGDLFHEDVPEAWVDRVFAVMALCPQHIFQVLTKRADRMREYFEKTRHSGGICNSRAIIWDEALAIATNCGLLHIYNPKIWPLPNVWLGVSTEDQTRADQRIPHLLATPAAVRFVSAEPLLGPVDLTRISQGHTRLDTLQAYRATPTETSGIYLNEPTGGPCLDWLICGGESGRGARPMHPDWARSLRDQGQAAGVAFFMKQMTRKAPIPDDLFIREYPDDR